MAGLQFWDWYGDRSTVVVDVGLACCTLEFESALQERPQAMQGTVDDLAGLPPAATVVVVISGTVTDRLALTVRTVVDRIRGVVPAAKVIAFGACASAGGPYWDSYAVTKGIDQLVAVDAYVPGCPPPPDALAAAIDELAGRTAHV